MAEITEKIGGRIRELREARKAEDPRWTQDYLARQLSGNRTGTEVSRWERGEVKPRDETLEELARILGTTVADFYAGPISERQAGEPLDTFSEADRLARVEAKLDRVLAILEGDEQAEETTRLAGEAQAEASQRVQPRPRTRGAASA